MTNRRDFLKLSGSVSILPALGSTSLMLGNSGTALAENSPATQGAPSSIKGVLRGKRAGLGAPKHPNAFEPLPYSNVDELSLAKGFSWYAIASCGDSINAKGDKFGDCCDFTAAFSGSTTDRTLLWVNHEYVIPNLVHGRPVDASEKTKEMVDAEMKLVGGSLLELQLSKSGKWEVDRNSKKAFRIDANTDIPMVGPAGGRTVKGTMGNCGGGFTPWRTALSGEENIVEYYDKELSDETYGWGKYYDRSVMDYGWVVEIDVDSGLARKLTALGRFAHEGATLTKAKDGRAVVYMGDDSAGQCLYKFVSTGKISGNKELDKDLLLEGQLYVANLKDGKWLSLDPENKKLSADKDKRFLTLKDILNNTREAAKTAGGSPLNRAEDVKVHPVSGMVYFTLTNNQAAGDVHGHVVMLEELNSDAGSLSFAHSSYLTGGPQVGFSCPDNLTFGPKNSLWICTDISGKAMGKGAHAAFARNSVFRVEEDQSTGTPLIRHFLQAPWDAEITGPSFSLDKKTFFLSIQHPGESSFQGDVKFTSNWPEGAKTSTPKSTLIGVFESGKQFS